MSGAAFLRLKKLNGGGIIKLAARHNKRSIQAEVGTSASIYPIRSHLNESLAGPSTADEVDRLSKKLMADAGVTRLRKDAVRGVEVIFSLPPTHAFNDTDYFRDCVTWVGTYFGGIQNILSADIHRDEAAPHCHILILPLIKGRMNGSRLVGNKQKLIAMQTQFHQDVAARYGLQKAPARLSRPAKLAGSRAVIKMMRQTGDKALQSAAWPCIRAGIEDDPRPYMTSLGIEVKMPKKKLRTMAAIFTSKGKGKAIERNLCSVGFAEKAHPLHRSRTPPKQPDR